MDVKSGDLKDTASQANLAVLLETGRASRANGDLEETISCFQRALEVDPSHSEALMALADTYLRAGLIHDAAQVISSALEQYPLDVDVLNASGLIMKQAGLDMDARRSFELALRVSPDNQEALWNLSDLLMGQKRWSDAIWYLKKIHIKDDNVSMVKLALGTAFLRTGDFEDAVNSLNSVLRNDPDNLAALINTGVAYRCLRQYEKSKRQLTRAHFLAPGDSCVLSALSTLYADMKELDLGIRYGEEAASKAPGDTASLNCCAYAYMKSARFEKAFGLYEKILSIDAKNPQGRLGKATIHLLNGHLKEGWKYFDSRFQIMGTGMDGPWPIWAGESIRGKKVLVRAEQGAGDTIQFCRFLLRLKALGPEIIFSCQPFLGRLMQCFSKMARVSWSKGLVLADEQIDFQTTLMELPRWLQVDHIDDIPGHCPYLDVDKALVEAWKGRLSTSKKLKVGLVWAGNPNQTDDHNRSIHLRELLPLKRFRQEVQFYSLQVGYAAEQAEDIGAEFELIDLAQDLADFADTAAAMENLDLVISVCTSAAHLSGALGRPTIVLLPFVADWRWFLNRHDSPWYPSSQLIRQPRPGDWDNVLSLLAKKMGQVLTRWKQKQNQCDNDAGCNIVHST